MSNHLTFRRISAVAASATLLASALLPVAAQAAGQLTTRSVTLSNPTVGQTAVTQTHTFTSATTATLKSIEFQTCTTAFGACTAPTGLTYAGAATGSNPTTLSGTGMGAAANWIKDATSTVNNARYTFAANAGSTTSGSAITFAFNGVTNGTAANTPYYVRITTFSDSAFTTSVDSGNVVAVPTQALTVTGTVQEQLTFCVYNTGGSCVAGVTGAVALGAGGILSSSIDSTNTSKFDLTTNANGGVTVTYAATSFTGPSQTIGNAGVRVTQGAPATGSETFLIQVAGTGTITPNANYTAANYSFQGNNTPDTLATATPTAGSTGTVTYHANIANTTKPGVYSSVFDYQAIATF